MKNVKQYYKELGRVLYAIAIADGVIQPEESDKLHHFVLKELAHHESTYDSSGMNQAFYVDFEFEELAKNHPEPNGTISQFKRFLEKSLEPGDSELLQVSIRLMESVANAYSKKKEKGMIEQVKSIADLLLKTRAAVKAS